MTRVAFIGFGEAGGLIAEGLRGAGADVRSAYDILIDDGRLGPALADRARALGITATRTAADAVDGADIIVSAVTCEEIAAAAASVASALRAGQIYLDINSASPKAKREAAGVIEPSGAAFVEAAVMDLVPPHGHEVPMLLAGARAHDTQELLRPYGMNVTAIGDTIGQASAVKMVRSVFMKGFSAILLECLMAAAKLGAEKPVLDSLQTSYPELDWHDLADRSTTRLVQHAKRQSAEMLSVAETLEELGIEPITALATAKRLGWFADQDLGQRSETAPASYADVLKLLEDAGETN